MADGNSTSKGRLPRNRGVLAASVKTEKRSKASLRAAETEGATAHGNPCRNTLHEAIEAERGQLSQAQAVLECLRLALEYGSEDGSTVQPYYPDVVDVALGIVRGSVNRLDSIYIRPIVDAVCNSTSLGK